MEGFNRQRPPSDENVDISKRSFLKQAVAGGMAAAGIVGIENDAEAAESIVSFGSNWTGIFGNIKLTTERGGELRQTRKDYIFVFEGGKTCNIDKTSLRMNGSCEGVVAGPWNNQNIIVPGGAKITFE